MSDGVWRTRPGADAIAPASHDAATDLGGGIWMSPGLSNSYLLSTGEGRVVVNCGMGFEGPVHRRCYDAVDGSPTRYVLLTQGHFDHVGGVDQFLDDGTDVVTQVRFTRWRDDNERLERFRSSRAAFAWIDAIMAAVDHARRVGDSVPAQSRPAPTVTFHDRLDLTVGGRRIELLSTPGGETTDSMIVWLPHEGVCITGNVFGPLFGHLPNLVTMRGDRYRDALEFVESLELVRSLGARRLLTGHFDPIDGAGLIDRELGALREAVLHLHDGTVDAMNAGHDVHGAMAQVRVPDHLDIGEGYGQASWNVRAIWENYSGWFHHRSTTELYPISPMAAAPDLVELAGADALMARARAHLEAGRAVESIQLIDHLLAVDPTNPGGRDLAVAAHEHLLAGSTNFWETAWLRRQVDKLGA